MKKKPATLLGVIVLLASLGLAAPAAYAAEYWGTNTVKNNNGATLGQGYGRGYNTSQNAVSNATYRFSGGDYAIYVRASVAFWYYQNTLKRSDWGTNNSINHASTGSGGSTAWKTTTRSYPLVSTGTQSRISAAVCTEVPFLVPGNCAGTNYLTNPY